MESVKAAKKRFRQYPVLLGKCSKEATVYATCVLNKDNINLNNCDNEFRSFKKCLLTAASALKTKI